eukprot:m.234416 g.234416  ORF g.234416 m.234416 type:complete len:186 (-) comp15748_c0_seq3:1942-2499(-)
MGFEAPLKHHDENVPPCFPQKHPHLEDVATVPLPSVEVEVSGTKHTLDTLKLNPSSALHEGRTPPAKVFNRLLQHKSPEETVDAMVSALTNSSIVMALILTISIPEGSAIDVNEDSIWGDDVSNVKTVISVYQLLGLPLLLCYLRADVCFCVHCCHNPLRKGGAVRLFCGFSDAQPLKATLTVSR